MGITVAFENAEANFSPITDAVENIWISKVQCGVHAITDGKGVKVVFYTVEEVDGATALIQNEINFVLSGLSSLALMWKTDTDICQHRVKP